MDVSRRRRTFFWQRKKSNDVLKRSRSQQGHNEKNGPPSLPTLDDLQERRLNHTQSAIDLRSDAKERDDVPSLRQRLREAEQHAEEQQRHLAKLQGEWEREIEEAQAQRRVIELRTHERDEAHKMLGQLDKEVKAMETQFKKLEERRREKDEDAARQLAEAQEGIAFRDKELDDERSQVQTSIVELKKQETAIQKVNSELESLRLEKDGSDQGLAAAKEELERMKNDLGQAKSKVEAEMQISASLRTELAEAKSESESTRAECDSVRKEHQTSHEELLGTRNQLKDLTERANVLEAEKADLTAQIDAGKTGAVDHETRLATLQAEKNAVTAELEAVKATAAEQLAQTKADQADQAAAMMEAQKASSSIHEEEVESLKAELSTARAALAALEAQPLHSASSSVASTPTRKLESYKNEFSEPVRFTSIADEDLRVGINRQSGEVKVDIREWSAGVRSRHGITITTNDAEFLAGLLPHVVKKAEYEMKARPNGI